MKIKLLDNFPYFIYLIPIPYTIILLDCIKIVLLWLMFYAHNYLKNLFAIVICYLDFNLTLFGNFCLNYLIDIYSKELHTRGLFSIFPPLPPKLHISNKE